MLLSFSVSLTMYFFWYISVCLKFACMTFYCSAFIYMQHTTKTLQEAPYFIHRIITVFSLCPPVLLCFSVRGFSPLWHNQVLMKYVKSDYQRAGEGHAHSHNYAPTKLKGHNAWIPDFKGFCQNITLKNNVYVDSWGKTKQNHRSVVTIQVLIKTPFTT